VFKPRRRHLVLQALRLTFYAALLVAAVLVVPRTYAALRYQGHVQPGPDASGAPVAIVFGAGLKRDGTPTLILADRMAAAAELYRAGKVEKLLLSGGNQFVDYNEPQSMFEYGQQLGIPASAMVLDYAGRRTYDTCLRARDIFQVRQAVLVTQRYHLDRALLTCDALGLDVQGVAADLSPYPPQPYFDWWTREWPATTKAVWDLYIDPPENVILGEPLPIVTTRFAGSNERG
jgi:SanA protein